jgi:hypothetical protein
MNAPLSKTTANDLVAERPNVFGGVMAQLAAPDLQLSRWSRLFRDVENCRVLGRVELSIEHAQKHRAMALARYRYLPPGEDLDRWHIAFQEAAYGESREPEARLLVGLMLDANPTARSFSSETYTDAIAEFVTADDARDPGMGFIGFTPAVVAAAVREILRTQKFVPTIAEFLEVTKRKRMEFWQAMARTQTAIVMRENAERILIETGDLTVAAADDGMDDEVPF